MTPGSKRDEAIVPWDEWPDPFRTLAPVPAHAPIHEPEPGLLDEEILDLKADWLKVPNKTIRTRQRVQKILYFLRGV